MKTSDEIERQKKRDATRQKRELAAKRRQDNINKKREFRALQKKLPATKSESQKAPVVSRHSARVRTVNPLENVSKTASAQIPDPDSLFLLEEKISDENIECDNSYLVFTQTSPRSYNSFLLEQDNAHEHNKHYRDYGNNLSKTNSHKNLELHLKSARKREQVLRRKVVTLQKVIDRKNKIISRLRVQLYRLNKKKETTPERNVKKIMKKSDLEIRKRLLLSEVLENQLNENKSKMKTEKDKSVYSQILSGNIIKKYRFMKSISGLVSPHLQRKALSADALKYNRSKIQKTKLNNSMKKIVQDFLEKDENSALAPGKKDTITKLGLKMRKRYLQDSVDNLYTKFRAVSKVKMSRSLFYKLKPFWIVKQPISARNTCLCKVHANIDLILKKLLQLKILPSSSTKQFTDSVTCNSSAKACMYRECEICKEKSVALPKNSDPSFYYQWITKTEDRIGAKNVNYRVKITAKTKIECNSVDIVKELNLRTSEYLRHVYDTSHQHTFFEKLRNTLCNDEVMIVIDFSENYSCKYSAEIQSVHFGASRKQISLHTGAFFYLNKDSKKIQCVSFCTVSECLRHDASSVWAHLQPILKLVKQYVPTVTALHFQSDGPSTQYKNKTNFFLFSYYCNLFQLHHASWNFSTSGHGKSVADGTGGTVKGLCDRAVAQGKDITSAQDMINLVSNSVDSKINIFLVTEIQMTEIDKLIINNLKPAPNSTKIHQLLWKNKEKKIYI